MKYDLIIVGGSAAATAAGIYAARRNLNFTIVAKEFGGEVATSGEIGNYPGIPNTDGIKLSGKFLEHLKSYGIKPELGITVTKIAKQDNDTFCITTKKNGTPKSAAEKLPKEKNNGTPTCDYEAKAVIVTTGVHPRELNVPGEKEFRNKGVSYCTVCDGPIFKDKITATIGGGNSALESALMLSDIASKTYVINKNPAFKGDHVLIEKVTKSPKIEIIYNVNTIEILGNSMANGLKYKDIKTGEEKSIEAEGIFIHIGMIPNSTMFPEEVRKNKYGAVEITCTGETNIPGLYAAGDVTALPHNQIIIAAGQGAAAVLSVVNYLNKLGN